MRRRVLVVAEAVTLAHVARPLALARILERLGYDVRFACATAASQWLALEGRAYDPIWSISSDQFKRMLAQGSPLYDRATLVQYVEHDLELIDRTRPDVIIGDFRLSLHVSARLRQRPYGAIANAYWSRRYFEVSRTPDLSFLRWLAPPVADAAFRASYRAAFRWHARPFLEVCKHFGVAAPGPSILDVYTSSDCTALADAEEFYRSRGRVQGGDQLFVGPLHWSPPIALPSDHEQWGLARPLVYLSLGSSGSSHALLTALEALGDIPIDVVATTAGTRVDHAPVNATLLDYAPGDEICKRAALVIGNGGNLIAYQALSAGVPLLGLTSNLDQCLNMRMIERIGAGRALASFRLHGRDVRAAALALLADPASRGYARRASEVLATYDVPSRVAGWLSRLGA